MQGEIDQVAERRLCRSQYVMALLLLVAFGILSKYYDARRGQGHYVGISARFPKELGGWIRSDDFLLSEDVVNTLKVDEYMNSSFMKGRKQISLYIGYYHSHREFAEIHTPENCQANAGWEILRKRDRVVNWGGSPGQRKIHFVEAVYEKDTERYIMIYFYKLMDCTTTNFFMYKLRIVLNSILENRSDASFVRIIVPISSGDEEEAIGTAEQFLADLIPVIFRVIP